MHASVRWDLGARRVIGRTAVRRAWLGVASLLAAATAVVWSGWGGDATSTAVADLSAVVAALGGAVVVHRARRARPAGRRGWRVLTLAMVLWGLGELLWTWYEVIAGQEVPFPSPADIAYLGAVPVAIAGLLTFGHGSGTGFRARTVLDGCLVSGSLLFVVWALALGPVVRSDTSDLWVHVVSISYPVTDLLLASVALIVVQWGGTTERAALRAIALAVLTMAVADTAFTWLTNNGTYTSSNPITMLWPASYVLLAFASTLDPKAREREDEGGESLASLLTPYLALLGALGVAVPRLVGGHALGPFLTVNGSILVVLVLVRQAITTLDLRTTVATLHQRETELERLAMEDPLTGLANRASFAQRLEAAVTRPGSSPAVVYIDLDEFKTINDRYGHSTGDELLVEVSRRLQACVPASATLARLGGDEFVVLVETGHQDAVELARRALQSFSVPFRSSSEVIPFRASVGIASAPRDGSPDEAVRRADAAMYVAKTSGKGRVVAYPDEAMLLSD